MMSEVVFGADGLARCSWGASTPEYQLYHDLEWGRPIGDEKRIYEKLCLEGFQSGLSWLTILRKRDAFRKAFAGFDPDAVARFGTGDVERLLSDSAIVRNRSKIVATINNAQATVRLRQTSTSLATLVWAHEPPQKRPPDGLAALPGSTPESKALSTELRKHGFRFVGPTTVYASMQSLGVVNDHFEECHFRAEVDSERSTFVRP
jgi:DNA-3-methyladenine glycosylase I